MVLKREKNVHHDGATLTYTFNADKLRTILDNLWEVYDSTNDDEIGGYYDSLHQFCLLEALEENHECLNVGDETVEYSLNKRARWMVVDRLKGLLGNLTQSPDIHQAFLSIRYVETSNVPHCQDVVIQSKRNCDKKKGRRHVESAQQPSHRHYRGVQRKLAKNVSTTVGHLQTKDIVGGGQEERMVGSGRSSVANGSTELPFEKKQRHT